MPPTRQHRRKHFRATAIDPNTIFLCHFDGPDGAIAATDVAGFGNAPHPITFSGNAQLDTAQQKFGSASLLLDGTADKISLPASADWNLGSTWTYESWIRSTTFSSAAGNTSWFLARCVAGDNDKWFIYMYTLPGEGGTWRFRVGSLTGGAWDVYFYTSATTLSDNTWYHWQVTRDGSNWYVSIDGTAALTNTLLNGAYANGTNQSTGTMYIGAGEDDSWAIDGWLDEYRISTVARYTSFPFAPTGPFIP